MSVADAARGLHPHLFTARSDAATGERPPRRGGGPVMMGDIHGTLGGTPTLLLLWDRWEREAADDGEG
jgi:hypothetical protein